MTGGGGEARYLTSRVGEAKARHAAGATAAATRKGGVAEARPTQIRPQRQCVGGRLCPSPLRQPPHRPRALLWPERTALSRHCRSSQWQRGGGCDDWQLGPTGARAVGCPRFGSIPRGLRRGAGGLIAADSIARAWQAGVAQLLGPFLCCRRGNEPVEVAAVFPNTPRRRATLACPPVSHTTATYHSYLPPMKCSRIDQHDCQEARNGLNGPPSLPLGRF